WASMTSVGTMTMPPPTPNRPDVKPAIMPTAMMRQEAVAMIVGECVEVVIGPSLVVVRGRTLVILSTMSQLGCAPDSMIRARAGQHRPCDRTGRVVVGPDPPARSLGRCPGARFHAGAVGSSRHPHAV